MSEIQKPTKAMWQIYAVIVVAFFSVIGAITLLRSQAASRAIPLEAEAAAPSGSFVLHTGMAGTSGSSYVTLAANTGPTPTAQPSGCGSGGSCTLADITPHATATDCRSAINVDGTVKAYAIPESWLTIHRDNFKTITTKLCGKVFSGDLHSAVGEHRSGEMFDGKQFMDWISNFYIGPYQ